MGYKAKITLSRRSRAPVVSPLFYLVHSSRFVLVTRVAPRPVSALWRSRSARKFWGSCPGPPPIRRASPACSRPTRPNVRPGSQIQNQGPLFLNSPPRLVLFWVMPSFLCTLYPCVLFGGGGGGGGAVLAALRGVCAGVCGNRRDGSPEQPRSPPAMVPEALRASL